jgi:hypothetical protein
MTLQLRASGPGFATGIRTWFRNRLEQEVETELKKGSGWHGNTDLSAPVPVVRATSPSDSVALRMETHEKIVDERSTASKPG